jgi:hypothetical protein
MKKLLTLFIAFVCVIGHAASVTALSESAKIEQEVLQGKIYKRMEQSLDRAIRIGADELTKRGHSREAQVMMFEWQNQMRYQFQRWGEMNRDIGDHPDQILSEWLDEKYAKLESILGIQLCTTLHLTALKIFNDTPKIILRPCTFDMNGVTGERVDEYKRNFAKGAKYMGGFSETVFFGTYIACAALSAGTGFSFFCGTIGDLAEKIVASYVAPGLAKKIYTKVCHGTEVDQGQ